MVPVWKILQPYFALTRGLVLNRVRGLPGPAYLDPHPLTPVTMPVSAAPARAEACWGAARGVIVKFAESLSTATDRSRLAAEMVAGVQNQGVSSPNVAFLFFTAALREHVPELAAEIRETLQPEVLLGVSAESVVGGGQEVERAPAAALLAGELPGVTLRPFHIGAQEWQTLLSDDERLQQRIGAGAEHRGQVVLGDPFTTPVDELLPRLDSLFNTPTCGGMASAGQFPGSNLLLLNDRIYTDGAVGLGIGGSVRLEAVVSQGCRPIGEPLVVTRADQNTILEFGRRPALEVAQEMLNRLPEAEKQLIRNNLFVGVVINEYQSEFRRGDFLVRHLMGGDPKTGAVVVGDLVRPGQTVQFHIRDTVSAHEDLVELLRARETEGAAGGLLFSCNGRGTRMFPEPHHDAQTTREHLPGLPLAGFFAMGELGPIGGKSFIHGHTASLLLFRPAEGE